MYYNYYRLGVFSEYVSLKTGENRINIHLRWQKGNTLPVNAGNKLCQRLLRVQYCILENEGDIYFILCRLCLSLVTASTSIATVYQSTFCMVALLFLSEFPMMVFILFSTSMQGCVQQYFSIAEVRCS